MSIPVLVEKKEKSLVMNGVIVVNHKVADKINKFLH